MILLFMPSFLVMFLCEWHTMISLNLLPPCSQGEILFPNMFRKRGRSQVGLRVTCAISHSGSINYNWSCGLTWSLSGTGDRRDSHNPCHPWGSWKFNSFGVQKNYVPIYLKLSAGDNTSFSIKKHAILPCISNHIYNSAITPNF